MSPTIEVPTGRYLAEEELKIQITINGDLCIVEVATMEGMLDCMIQHKCKELYIARFYIRCNTEIKQKIKGFGAHVLKLSIPIIINHFKMTDDQRIFLYARSATDTNKLVKYYRSLSFVPLSDTNCPEVPMSTTIGTFLQS